MFNQQINADCLNNELELTEHAQKAPKKFVQASVTSIYLIKAHATKVICLKKYIPHVWDPGQWSGISNNLYEFAAGFRAILVLAA